MLAYVFYGLFILACIILILVILLQPGKADAGALFTSSVSSTAFGPRGTQTLLAKITIGAAAAFTLLCAAGLWHLQADDDLRQLQSSPAELTESQRKVAVLLGLPSPAQFFLVEGRDPDAFAASARRLLDDDDLARRMSAAGSDRARRFTWSTSAARLRRLYADLGARRLVECR